MKRSLLGLLGVALVATAGAWWLSRPPPPNLLVIVADDIGVERLAAWDEPHDTWPRTPALDALAEQGLVFERAYANPLCSSTRAAVLTGRYTRRFGTGTAIRPRDRHQVPVEPLNLAKLLAEGGYTTIALGKWHLSSPASPDAYHHPLRFGFDHHRGFLGRNNYTRWTRTDDGKTSTSRTYVTQATTDDLIQAANQTEGPWFIWAAYQNAHAPIHTPPKPWNPRGVTDSSPPLERWHAMIEAMDLELGRAFRAIDPDVLANTVVVFFGDNGSLTRFMPDSWEPGGGKGSVSESGVRVPLIIAGPGVRQGRTDALVHVVDLLPTLAELAGVKLDLRSTVGDWDQTEPKGELDGTSVAALLGDPEAQTGRRYVYTENFSPLGNGPRAVDLQSLRDARWKLTANKGRLQLHDLQGRHDDGPALTNLTPEQRAIQDRLHSVLQRHTRVLSP